MDLVLFAFVSIGGLVGAVHSFVGAYRKGSTADFWFGVLGIAVASAGMWGGVRSYQQTDQLSERLTSTELENARLRVELKDANEKIFRIDAEKLVLETQVQKITPMPVAIRLRELLNEIDPKILPALKHGRTDFGVGPYPLADKIPMLLFSRLKELAEEDGADEFIKLAATNSIGPGTVAGAVFDGLAGQVQPVVFQLDAKLLESNQ